MQWVKMINPSYDVDSKNSSHSLSTNVSISEDTDYLIEEIL